LIDLEERLAGLESSRLRRRLRLIDGPQGPRVMLDGRPVLLLCSNNYLGLATHPRLREAAADAAVRLGTSAGASRLISGSTDAAWRAPSPSSTGTPTRSTSSGAC